MSTRARSRTSARRLPRKSALQRIRMLLLDVDGVLTDGRIWFDAAGNEHKQFHVHDAAGIVYWHRHGGLSGFLSGRGGDIVERRGRELGVHELLLKRVDKAAAFGELLARRGLDPAEVAYVGDDVLDLPVLRQVGLAATVPEARAEVLREVHFVTARSCGFGAVRDVVELLLAARGVWQGIVATGGQL